MPLGVTCAMIELGSAGPVLGKKTMLLTAMVGVVVANLCESASTGWRSCEAPNSKQYVLDRVETSRWVCCLEFFNKKK